MQNTPGASMGLTIFDVAKKAKVSKSTVSRVLNNSYGVSPDAVEAVQKAVKELGFSLGPVRGPGRPKKSRTMKTGNIAFMVPDTGENSLHTPLSSKLLRGIERSTAANEINLLLAHLDLDSSMPVCVRRKQVDGVIIRAGTKINEIESKLSDLPYVVIFETEHPLNKPNQVHPDNAAIGRLAFNYLQHQQCRKIAIVSFATTHPASKNRVREFLFQAENSGFNVLNNQEKLELIPYLKTLIKQKVDGLFLPLGDDMIEDVYRFLSEAGRKPVEDIKIISCNNDINRLRALDPRLPNIDLCAEEIGRIAMELLLQNIADPNQEPRRIIIQPKLVE